MVAQVVPACDGPRVSAIESAFGSATGPPSAQTTTQRRTNPKIPTTASSLRVLLPVIERDLRKALAERSHPRRVRFWIMFLSYVGGILWNVASPIKSYILSFYGLPGDDLVFSHKVDWTTEIDYQYARALYDMSGVKFAAPEGKPIRFINMYMDFVVFNRATRWAHNLDDYQQDPYIGLFCRTSLVPKADKIKPEMESFCSKKSTYAGNNYLEQKSCRVNEVSEAVMCLKGINVTELLNYEWDAKYNTSDPHIREGARLYQAAIFPDLDACLDRRRYLVNILGRDEALHQLTQELAANYSLDPMGFAGKKGLFADVRFYDGFYDFTTRLSGMRYSRMDGSLPQRTQPLEPDLNALVLGRERMWWLVGNTPENFQKKVLINAYFAPYLFMGMHIDNKATSGRFVDRFTVAKAGTVGVCQNWDLLPTSHKTYPDPIYLDAQPSNNYLGFYTYPLSSRRLGQESEVAATNAFNSGPSPPSNVCLARDDCRDTCTLTGVEGWVATFDRSGLCQAREILPPTRQAQGFADWRCLGEGVGADAAVLYPSPNVSGGTNSTGYNHTIADVANPGAIIACILGGRVPQVGEEPYPNVFFDLVNAGPNVMITTTLSRGTEKLLLNVNALLSLVGCGVFSFWVLWYFFSLLRVIIRTVDVVLCDSRIGLQLLDSLFTSNVSTVIHGRNIQLSKVILWLNLIAWYVGAVDSNCTWWVDGVDLWSQEVKLKSSDSPYYKCKPGAFLAHSGSFLGIMRILAMSYNFYSLTSQHLLFRGATRYARSFVSHLLLFGSIPTLVGTTIVTVSNHLRLHIGKLDFVHNQLFLVLLWTVYLFAYHTMLRTTAVGRFYVDFGCRWKVCGKQKIKHGTVAEALVGSYYLTLPELARTEEVEWIPLSVAMESALFRLDHLDITARKYSLTIPVETTTSSSGTLSSAIPKWVRDNDEYFFR